MDAGLVGVRTRASEDTVEVAVRGPRARSAAENAEEDVEDRIGQGVGNANAHAGHQDLDALPTCGAQEPDGRACDDGPHGCVEELVFSPSTVDDLRQYEHERERRDEVGDLVVEQNGFEELPQKARRAQHDAEQDQGYDVFSRHYPVTTVRYMPGNPYWKTPSGTRGSGGCGFFARRNGECFVQNAVVGPYLGVLRAGVDGVLEDLCAAVGVEGPTYAPDQLLRLA